MRLIQRPTLWILDKFFLLITTIDYLMMRRDPKTSKYSNHGRVFETSSGVAFFFVAYAFFANSYALFGVNPILWSWVFLSLGLCQLLYYRLEQRLVFSFMSSGIWLALTFYAWNLAQGVHWTIGVSTCLSLAMFNFYVYGFLYNEYKVGEAVRNLEEPKVVELSRKARNVL